MSAKKIVHGLLIVVVMGGLVAGGYFQWRAHRYEASMMEPKLEQASLAAQYRTVQGELMTLRRASMQAKSAAAPAAAEAPAAAAPTVEIPNAYALAKKQRPDLVQKIERQRVHLRLAQLERRLNVSDAQSEMFERELAGLEQENLNRAELLLKRANLFMRAAVALGPAGYAEAENTLKAAPVVNTLAAAMYSSETPLTAEQGALLTKVLGPQIGQQNTWETVDWDAVMAQMKPTLAPAQLAALQGIRDQAEFARAYYQATGQTLPLGQFPQPRL